MKNFVVKMNTSEVRDALIAYAKALGYRWEGTRPEYYIGIYFFPFSKTMTAMRNESYEDRNFFTFYDETTLLDALRAIRCQHPTIYIGDNRVNFFNDGSGIEVGCEIVYIDKITQIYNHCMELKQTKWNTGSKYFG